MILSVIFLTVNLCNEKGIGIDTLYLAESPAEKLRRHHLHHIAAETINPFCNPKFKHLQHLFPGITVVVIELDGIVPVIY